MNIQAIRTDVLDKTTLTIHQTCGKPFSRRPSVVFVSLHKCATTFFSRHVLPHSQGLTHIDHQYLLYQNKKIGRIICRPFGYVYGVYRIHEENHPLNEPTSIILAQENLQDKQVIFLVRDPRDILVSMYYSFGFSHGYSPNPKIREFQLARRQAIAQMTIDEYAINTAHDLNLRFSIIDSLTTTTRDHVLLRYEDMIQRFNKFFSRLTHFLPLNGHVKSHIYDATRPREVEQPPAHKRSGRVGDHRSKFRPETIATINSILRDTLRTFSYDV